MLEPRPKMGPRPLVDDPEAARWRTVRSCDGTPMAEHVCVDAVSLAECIESRELFLQLLICKCDLILLGLTCVGLRLLAAELRGEIAIAGAIVGGGGAIGGALTERVECGVCGPEALLGDRGLLLRSVALAIKQAVDGGHEKRAVLLALLAGLGDELILLRELLVGEIASGLLRGA